MKSINQVWEWFFFNLNLSLYIVYTWQWQTSQFFKVLIVAKFSSYETSGDFWLARLGFGGRPQLVISYYSTCTTINNWLWLLKMVRRAISHLLYIQYSETLVGWGLGGPPEKTLVFTLAQSSQPVLHVTFIAWREGEGRGGWAQGWGCGWHPSSPITWEGGKYGVIGGGGGEGSFCLSIFVPWNRKGDQ
jgi:hypothetical protein